MYSFDLAAGDTVRIDADSAIFDSGLDTVLRVFDADGNEVAGSDDDFAPDELFAPGRRDSYVEYTATEAGTYYVGVSSFGNGVFDFFQNDDGTPTNNPYDPNVAGSGTGRSFGDYTLNLTLNEPFAPVETEIPDSTGEGPTVSLSASPAVYDDSDRLLASALVQFVESGASILTLELSVDGEIPEEGVEVYLNSDIDLSSAFSTRSPFNPVGEAEVLGAIFDDQGLPTGLRIKLTSNTTVINLNLDNADEAPTDGVQPVSFTLEPSAGYQVGEDTFSTSIYDTLADVPVMPDVPTVGVTISETALVESEGNLTTLTFTLDNPPPAEGVLINVDSGQRAALGEFDVFNAEIIGGDFPSPNFRASGFFFRMTEQTATITLAAFDETTNPEIPAEDALEGIEEFTFTIQPGVGYAIAPDASEITLTIADNPDSVPLPDDGGNGDSGNGSGLPTETEFNDTIADAIATGLSVTNPVYEVAGEIGTTRQTRNLIDRSEDVDMYAFDLEAGQTLILDVDGGGSGSAGVAGSLLDSVLRIFDAGGNEVAINENGGAPDEVFQANGDSYIEFTAPDTATYYVGISNLGNNSYDPNVAGSGSGWTFNDRFEPGPYRLKATIDGVLVTDNDSVSTNNDTITNAQVLDLSADNPNLLVEAEFAQRFEDRSNTADATEDVDMFAVQLEAGDRITIDADSVLLDFEGFPSGPAPDLRIFNATGEELEYVRIGGAPDEAFVAGRDSYIDFTATEAGTYYIGASQYRNDSYDPNVVGSGSGAVFSPRFGVSAGGPYTLAIALNPEGFNGPVYEEFTGDPPADGPVVSFAAVPGTFGRADDGNDAVVSSQLIESEPDAVGILDFTFSVDGVIPDGGLEVFVTSDTDISTYFEGLDSNPRVAVGGEITGGLYDANGGLIGFKVLLTANNARFPYNANDERDDDPTMPETLNFTLANGPDYIVSDTTASSTVTFYDDLAQVQGNGGPVPEVGITFDQAQLIESEGTEATLTVTITGDVPADGLLVYIDGEARGLLGEFDVFNAEVTGGAFPSPNGNASGFFFRVFENTATIKLSVFDETTNPEIPAEDALEGVENFSMSVIPNEAYTIDANASTIDFTILDNPDSVPLPDDGGNGNGGNGDSDVVMDNDGRNSIDDTIDTAVETGLSPNKLNVQVEGSIAVRWRNEPEQRADNTEDVDLYSFELVAGETVDINAESVPFELNGISQVTAPTLRLFNAAGEELAISASVLADGVVTDPSLNFTATEDGTYFVGVSQYLNDNYDPLVNASGDGVQLVDQGISPGEYTLDINLTTDRPSVPEVSFEITPEVVSEEDANPLVTTTFTVEGDIPPAVFDDEGNLVSGGLSILYQGPVNQILQQIAGDPETTTVIPGSFFDQDRQVFELILLENTSTITLEILNDVIQEADQDYAFSIIENDGSISSNYIVNPDASSDTITLIDGNGGPGIGPTVGISVTETELSEGDEFTVNFTVDGDIPAEGLTVLVDSETFGALGEFNLFNEDGSPAFTTTGIDGIPEVGDTGASSFLVTLTDPEASITLSVFDDGPGEGLESLTFSVIDGEVYEVSDTNGSFTLNINDESTGSGPLTTPGDDFIIAGVDFDGNGASIFAGAGNDEIDLAFDPTAQGNRVDAGSGNDLIFISYRDVVFGGPGDDVLDASDSRGRNRISGGDGNDDFFFGALDGARDIGIGGAGDDRFFFGLGGGNIAAGGEGADQFWVVNGEVPASANRITDFELDIDVIGFQGVDDLLPGINGSMIEATADGSCDTILAVDGTAFASISGVSPSELYIFDDEENDGRFFIGSQAQAEAAAFNRGPLG
ncbi:pre-peptidase C-terminal domain-containing protein [Acaryochloris sp. IP29b_bin.137]|uniref:pre-peptidase C-terminal domain-containing protein n=1 Tax=Acaryochloris sp. IP29b_bin.137 TaxID=2969217 RepID=UPI00344E02D2